MSNPSSSLTSSDSKSVHVVCQRFRYCRLMRNDTQWVTIGCRTRLQESDNKSSDRLDEDDTTSNSNIHENEESICGLLVYVSFAATATPALVQQAAITILNLPILTTGLWGDGVSNTCSILELATTASTTLFREATPAVANAVMNHVPTSTRTALVIVPQANLISKMKRGGKSLQYHGQISKEQGQKLYELFVLEVRRSLLEHISQHYQRPLPKWYQSVTNSRTSEGTSDVKEANTLPAQVSAHIPPHEMFRTDNCHYTAWDDNGIPTQDVNGEPLAKSAVKKLRKLFEAHVKRHEKWKSSHLTTMNEGVETNHNNNPTKDIASSAYPLNSANVGLDESTTVAIVGGETDLDEQKGNDDDTSEAQWSACLDSFCPVVAGTFGTRQGLELVSDMGPFCHVFQI